MGESAQKSVKERVRSGGLRLKNVFRRVEVDKSAVACLTLRVGGLVRRVGSVSARVTSPSGNVESVVENVAGLSGRV